MTERIAIALALTLVGAQDAYAYRCTRAAPEVGPSLAWGVRTIEWWANPAVANLAAGLGRDEARASFEAWSAPDCTDLEFPFAGVREGLVSEYLPDGLNRNVVVLLDEWPYDEGTIALTTAAFDTRSGLVLDADIELNNQQFFFDVIESACSELEAADLRNTLTHEVGHLIGLDHPPASARYEDTTMFGQAAACETKKRSLASDDIEGVCAIYPAGAPTQPCFPPDQLSFRVARADEGYGCSASRRGSLWPGPWLAALLLVGFRRRR